MSEPTEIQGRVLAYVAARIEEGLPPSLQEISAAFGWSSPAAAAHHLHALEKKGYVKRRAGTMRGLSLVQP
jgi:SOS-response transcriptional repressor LexA